MNKIIDERLIDGHLLDAYAFISESVQRPLQGRTPLTQFDRFVGDLPSQRLPHEGDATCEANNQLTWTLDGEQRSPAVEGMGMSGAAQYVMHIQLEAKPVVICQRCMQAFRYPLAHQTTVELIRSIDQLEQANASGEVVLADYERVLADPMLDVYDLLEDELILALPFAPHHEQCDSGDALLEAYATPAAESPFAVLAQLKAKSKRNSNN